jgi:outer membrane lipoprotein carrier protein
MIARFLFVVLFLALQIASTIGQELAPDQRAQLLQRLADLREKYPSLEADYAEAKKTHLLSSPLHRQGTVAFQAPDKFRREVKGINPSLTISNGKTMWIYYPNFNEAEQYTLGQRGVFDDSISALTTGMTFERVSELYDVRAFREEKLCRIELTPRRSNLKRIVQKLTIWMDDDLRGQKTELLLPKGDRVVTNYSNQSREPLPATTFEFTPPAGANVTRPLGK